MRGPAGVIGSWVVVVALFFAGLIGLAVVGDVEPTRASVALPDTPAGVQLEWVLSALDHLPPDEDIRAHFSDSFLDQISPSDLRGVFRRLRAGRPYAVTSIEASTARQLVVMLEGRGTRARTIIAVDEEPPHLISTLWFGPAPEEHEQATSWDEVDQRLREAAPEVGFLAAEITEEGKCRPIHAVEPTTALSLGSAFKLYVLGAAADAVRIGVLSWDTPVEVREDTRVHTSMRTESVESGTRVRLEELAGHMIEVSDNTATDLVMDAVGREAVEAVQAGMGMTEPQRNVPFLSTRELSLIKFRPASLVDEYLAASVQGRRALLEDRLANQPATTDDVRFTPRPVAVDTVEWFASASDLCRAQVALQDKGPQVRQILGRNPGISFGSNADYVAFKGGSEPGVLAGSWYVEHSDGRRFAISVLLRNREGPIDTTALSVAADAFHLASEPG